MKMANLFSPISNILVGIFMAAALSGCGGESTNLNDPSLITSTTKCSELAAADDKVVCVNGRFIDEAVVNLDYSCDKVNATTDVDGSFSCPRGSKVKFMLLNPDDKSDSAKKIIFGEISVKEPASFSSVTGEEFFYITPYDFGSAANNTVRLLQTLNRDTVADGLPSRRVIIKDDDKKMLYSLTKSLSPVDMAASSAQFEDLVDEYLNALSLTLISDSVADEYLDRAIYSTVAGAYFVPGYVPTYGSKSGSSEYQGDFGGMRGLSPSNYLVGALWAMVDRKGRMLSFGVYSVGAASDPEQCKFLVFKNTTDCPAGSQSVPNVLRMIPDVNSWALWPRDSSWRVKYDVLNSAGTAIDGQIDMTQGRIERGGMAGSSVLYQGIYGETPDAGTIYGRWQGGPASAVFSADTSITLVKSRPIAPTLDPDVWGSLTFPMNISLKFWSKACNPAGSTSYTCPVGDIRATILSDGNIVSNNSGLCGVGLNPRTLRYSGGQQEYPLGVVAEAFQSNGKSRSYITPIMMIPGSGFPLALQNVQMGTSAASTNSDVTGQLRIRVDQNEPAKFLQVYDNSTISSDTAVDVELTAYWSNEVARLQRATSYDGRLTSSKDGGCP